MLIRAYGVGCNIYFPLIDKGATDFEATPVTIATGDTKISKDGGAFANTNSNFAHLGGGVYSLALTATEMQAKNIVIKIIDQTGTKEWEDQCIIIDTVNHASAEIPSLWGILQSTASGAITATSLASDTITAAKIASDAITAAKIASDAITAAKIATAAITAAKFAAGAIDAAAIATDAIDADAIKADAVTEIQSGLSTLTQANIRSAVGLASANLDTQLTAIDDFLDTEIAAIKAKTDNLPSDPADASDIAAAFAVTNGKIDVVDDFLDTEIAAIKAKTDNLPSDPADASDIAALLSAISGYIDTEVAAIKAKTDLIPAAPAAVGDIPTAIQVADAVMARDVSNTESSAAIHSLASVVLKLTGRFVGSTGKTYRTDGVTTHMTQVPTTDPAADPITELGNAS